MCLLLSFFNISVKNNDKGSLFLIDVGISLVANHEIPRICEVFYNGQKLHCKV